MARSSDELQRMLIIEDIQNFLLSLERYQQHHFNGVESSTAEMASRLGTLYYRILPLIHRKLKAEEQEELLELFTDDDPKMKDLIRAYNVMNRFLDELGVTKIDVKNKLGGNIIARNETQGWG